MAGILRGRGSQGSNTSPVTPPPSRTFRREQPPQLGQMTGQGHGTPRTAPVTRTEQGNLGVLDAHLGQTAPYTHDGTYLHDNAHVQEHREATAVHREQQLYTPATRTRRELLLYQQSQREAYHRARAQHTLSFRFHVGTRHPESVDLTEEQCGSMGDG